MAFLYDGIMIEDETMDETGRFSVGPDYYKDKNKMVAYKDGYYVLTYEGYYLILDNEMEAIDNGWETLEEAKAALDRFSE